MAALPREVATQAQVLHTACGEGQMVWRRWGRGRPVVLLHGSHGSWTHWLRNVQALAAAGYEVWAADLPGAGDSALPAEGERGAPQTLVAPVLQGLAQALGERNCAIVAFSFGALVAARLIDAAPQRFNAWVLVGPAGMGWPATEEPPLQAWRHLDDAIERRAVHRHNLAALMLHRPGALDELAVTLQADNTARYRLVRKPVPADATVLNTIRSVPVPVAGIWGSRDVRVHERRERTLATLSQARDFRGMAWIEGAAHWVQYDAGDEFNAALLAALHACEGKSVS